MGQRDKPGYSLLLLIPTPWFIFYPLVLIPLGVTGAANGVNMLAGFNGL